MLRAVSVPRRAQAAQGVAGGVGAAAAEAAQGVAGGVGAAAGQAAQGVAGGVGAAAAEAAQGVAGGVGAAAGQAAQGVAGGAGAAAAEAAQGVAGGVGAAAGQAAQGAAGGVGAAAAGAAQAGAASAAGGGAAAGGATQAAAGGGGAAGGAPAAAGSAAAAPAQAAAGGAAGGGAAGAAAPAPRRDPSEDPNFQAMKGKAGAAGSKAKAHQPAAAGAAAAQAAAVPPGNEVASQAAGAQVEEMGAQQPGTFDRKAFIAAVQKAIDAAAPKNLEEADDFKGSGKTAQVKGEVGQLVKGGKKDAEKDIKTATDAPPDASKAKPKDVTPLAPEKPGEASSSVGAANAMPGPRPPEDTDLSAGPAQVDEEMEREGVTEEQLANSNEPDFTAALDARQTAKEHSATAPGEYRAQEQEVLAKGRDEAAEAESAGLTGMHGSKVAALAKVVSQQGEAKSQDESKRAKVAADIQAIYDKTKTDVTGILTGLDGKVESAFTSGEESARKQFEDYVGTKMDAYKDDRYSGWLGGARWLKDKLFGMPSEVNVFYSQGRSAYLTAMDAVIGQVADIVGGELNAARMRIAQGKTEVHNYVTQLPQDLQKVGKDAEGKLEEQFDQLSSDVDNKQDALVDTLAQKYVASRDALDSRIEELKAANKGLVDKALDAVVGVVKTILKLKDMLLNVLAKAADVIGDIISDPIGFLSNLIGGIKDGLGRFVDNIGTHLKEGLMGWLFGALGDAGIKMPKSFDLAGIFELVMDVLGLTYRNIRGRVAKIVGEPVVSKMEETVDVFKMLVTDGPAALWNWIKDKVGDFQEMVFGGLKDFIIERVIKGGVTWLLSLLNPAAAFIKACKAIYDIVMFIVERGSQIMEFVNSVLDSIGAIARGQLSVAAEKVEGALARALPLAIGFLASLLGLGGITDKIRETIDKVRKPIEKVVDTVVMGAVKGFKKMFGGAIGWVKDKAAKGKAWATGKVEAGKAWAVGKAKGIKDRLTGGGKDEEAEPGAGQVDDAASKAVKDEAGQEVERRAPGQVESPEKLDEVVAGVLADLRPRGLKSLRAVPEKDDPGVYDIVATASPGTVVGKKSTYDPSRRGDHIDPADPEIDAEMKAAGITSFGPFHYDARVPRFKIEPAHNPGFGGYTLADCANAPIYEPEIKSVANDKTPKQNLITARRNAALRALFGATQGIVEDILAHDDGKSPRPFVSLAAEDGISGGHSDQRHILGKGLMAGPRQVGLRAGFHYVNGTYMKLDSSGRASVFKDETTATAAVQAALTGDLKANWPARARELAEGDQVEIDFTVPVAAVAYTKHDAPPGTPYPDTDTPAYIDASKSGDRELFTGDYSGPGRPGDPTGPDRTKDPLTDGGATVDPIVHVLDQAQEGLARRLGDLHVVSHRMRSAGMPPDDDDRPAPDFSNFWEDVGRRSEERLADPLTFSLKALRDLFRVADNDEQGLANYQDKLESFFWWADDAIQCLERVMADPPPDLGRLVREQAGVIVWRDGGPADDAGTEAWVREIVPQLRRMYDAYVAEHSPPSS